MRTIISAAFLCAAFALHAQNTLTVEVTLNKPNAGGVVRVAKCPSSEAFNMEKGCTVLHVKADAPTVRVRFEGVQEGDVALKLFHDVDGNGKLDTNWMGIPKEPYGFSNDAMGTFGPPSWEQARISIKPGANVTKVRMKG